MTKTRTPPLSPLEQEIAQIALTLQQHTGILSTARATAYLAELRKDISARYAKEERVVGIIGKKPALQAIVRHMAAAPINHIVTLEEATKDLPYKGAECREGWHHFADKAADLGYVRAYDGYLKPLGGQWAGLPQQLPISVQDLNDIGFWHGRGIEMTDDWEGLFMQKQSHWGAIFADNLLSRLSEWYTKVRDGIQGEFSSGRALSARSIRYSITHENHSRDYYETAAEGIGLKAVEKLFPKKIRRYAGIPEGLWREHGNSLFGYSGPAREDREYLYGKYRDSNSNHIISMSQLLSRIADRFIEGIKLPVAKVDGIEEQVQYWDGDRAKERIESNTYYYLPTQAKP
jgi:hypothetical protein